MSPHGTCRWVVRPDEGGTGVLRINDQCYLLQRRPKGWLMTREESDRPYFVEPAVPRCNCPDYEFRRAERGEQCKHLLALTAALSRI